MQTRPLGRSDLQVSVVGLGCNNFGRRIDRERSRAVVNAALDAGVTFFDTADIYGFGQSESFLGDALGSRRDEAVIATKFGNDMGDEAAAPGPGGSRSYVRPAVEASLRRLATDRIDLLYYHRPDGVTPLGETLDAMTELVREGKVRAIAASNLSLTQLDEAAEHLRRTDGPPLAALQNHYSLLHRDPERDVLPRCAELGVAFIPYFPLEHGLLTGKYRPGEPPPQGTRLQAGDGRLTDEVLQRVAELDRFASQHGHSVLELAFAALLAGPAVASVIAGATRPEQVRGNVEAADWELTPGELQELRTV